jgi:TP901 family phage tail tape measure protein
LSYSPFWEDFSLPPTDTYKIQIESIKNSEADQPTKNLAEKVTRLASAMEKLESVMEKVAPMMGDTGRSALDTIRTVTGIAQSVERVSNKIQDTVQDLDNEIKGMKRDVPLAISQAKQTGQIAIQAARDFPYGKAILDAIKDLANTYRQSQTSPTYATGRDEVLSSISNLVREFVKRDRDVGNILEALKSMTQAMGMGKIGAPAGQPALALPSTIIDIKDFKVVTQENISAPIKELTTALKRVETNTQGEISKGTKIDNKGITDVLNALVTAARQLKTETPEKTGNISELTSAIKELTVIVKQLPADALQTRDVILKQVKSALADTTIPTKPHVEAVAPQAQSYVVAPTTTKIHGDVDFLGQALKNMGVEFEKIKSELKDKIVVAIDLETSQMKDAGKKDTLGNVLKTADIITQIATLKGTLDQIRSGTATKQNIYVKPPEGINTEKAYNDLIGTVGEAKIELGKLLSEGVNAKDAMSSLAETLKDADAIVGHNIAGFDLNVINDQFKKLGMDVNLSLKKYVDTVDLSRSNFPNRMVSSITGKRLDTSQPHALPQIEGDLSLAGHKFAGAMHEASHDVEVIGPLLNAFEEGTKEYNAMMKNNTAQMNAITAASRAAAGHFKEIGDTSARLSQSMAAASDITDEMIQGGADYNSKLRNATRSISAMEVMGDPVKMRSALQAIQFKEQVIHPSSRPENFGFAGPEGSTKDQATLSYLSGLSESLNKLQTGIVEALERGMTKGVQILKTKGESFQLAPGGREWELKIADVRELRKAVTETYHKYSAPGSSAEELVDSYKKAFVERRLSTPVPASEMAASVVTTIRGLTKEQASSLGEDVKNIFDKIQQRSITTEDVESNAGLYGLYKNVSLKLESEKSVEGYMKRLAIPAARVSQQGIPILETKYGAEKGLANFATITTGLEKLIEELKLLNTPQMDVERYSRQLSNIPLRPATGSTGEAAAAKLAEELLSEVSGRGGTKLISGGYASAATLKEVDRGTPLEEARTKVMGYGAKGLESLIEESGKLGVTALDVAKALSEIKLDNFYDMLNQLLQAGKVPYLEKQAANIHKFDRNLREVSGVINDVMGLMPMIEPGRPLRKPYDAASLRVLTKPTEELRPADAKSHIVEANLLWKDMAENSKKLGETMIQGKEYMGQPIASSLDLSDAASSELKQFNLEFGSRLQSIDKTMIGMNTSDLRGLSPFKDFSSIQRQVSYITSGLTGGIPGGGKFETPSLVSERERKSIESGQFGTEGYGLNVLTEIRNTAGTFEDQIMIAGKLAKAFTNIVQRLVEPGTKVDITEIESGTQRVSSRARDELNKQVGDVAKEFQTILGVPERYRGRADVAEIGKEVETVMREHRGQTIDVQTAKLTETFLDYFGRKLATRFGTKGVSITPETAPTEFREYQELAKLMASGMKAKIVPGEGLGYAPVPKSAGTLVSEMLSDAFKGLHTAEAPKELHDKLIESGNKFISDLFKDTRLVSEDEAKKQTELYERVNKIWTEKFGEELPTGPSGIKKIRKLYETNETSAENGIIEEGESRSAYTMQPIEARISARGIAKRGLMPEVLEAIINNLIGSRSGTTTIKDTIDEKVLTGSKEGLATINEYLSNLGYEKFTDIGEMVKRLKSENPKLTDADIDKLKEYESNWSVYTTILDEFGKKTQALVAPKFLQIIEEPHLFGEWTPRELDKGVKGAKLDYQSFSAYAGIFGEGSSMLKELAGSTSLNSKEGWELIRAFQLMDPTMKNLKESILEGLPKIELSDITEKFEGATGTVKELKDTILDIAKFPTAMSLKIPGAKSGTYDQMYVPGPALRGTYQEDLMGRAAPTNVARYLANLINSAKDVEELTGAAAKGNIGLGEEFQTKFASTLKAELVKALTDLMNRFKDMEKAPTPQNIAFMEEMIKKYKGGLSTERPVSPIYQEGLGTSEAEAFEAFAGKTKGPKKYSTTMGRLSDLLIGADPESLRREEARIKSATKTYEESGKKRIPYEVLSESEKGRLESGTGFETMMQQHLRRTQERGKAKSIFEVELEAYNLDAFTKKIGMSLQQSVEEALTTKMESLSRAKVAYAEALGEEVFGKKKGIEQTFFQRVTPAVTGKAVSAVTDKTEELMTLLTVLKDNEIAGLEGLSGSLTKIIAGHSEYVAKSKQLGLPVLKEGEIGLPGEMARKVPVEGGNLADLIKKQQETYVESIRYPFTGTLSVQPHKAKLMEDILPEGGKYGKYSIAVPGAPQLDLPELKKIIDTLREYIGVEPKKNLPSNVVPLMEQREKAWAENTDAGAQKVAELTKNIEQLLAVVDKASPKFIDMEQKLDFDGDALFVHTGQLEKSREEIKKHYDMLGSDVTAVRNLFRSVFSAVKDTDVASLSEMSQVFAKKHPKAKGFEFLTKPYVTEGAENLSMPEVIKALQEYSPEAAGKKPQEWMTKNLTSNVMPQVFGRLGVPEGERPGYLTNMKVSEEGLPTVGGEGQFVKRINELTEELLRRQLVEKKYSDAIEGQLFKLHTGITVEGISRIARMTELETGFGPGLAKTGSGGPPSKEFLSRWPTESMALDKKPAEAFAVRINEMLRFVIQKGMDVKHAGVEAVGQKIIENLNKATGAQKIKEAMSSMSEQFGELADFNAQISNEVRLRVGKLSTPQLKEELKLFEPDIDAAKLSNDREELIKGIISHVDMNAVFEEIFKQIQSNAIKGYTEQLDKQLRDMPAGPSKVALLRQVSAAGSNETVARQKIKEESETPEGISVLKYITTPLSPLYKMRTSMETIGTAARRSDVKLPEEDLGLPATEEGKRLAKTFDEVRKAANTLTSGLETSVRVPTRGVHTMMVESAIEKRYKDLKDLLEFSKASSESPTSFPYAFAGISDTSKMASKTWSESMGAAGVSGAGLVPPGEMDITSWIDQLLKAKKIAEEKLEELSEKAGLPQILPEEQALIGYEFEKQHGKQMSANVRDYVQRGAAAKGTTLSEQDLQAQTNEIYQTALDVTKFQATIVEQFRRIDEMIKTVPVQMAYLREAFPAFGLDKSTQTAAQSIQEAAADHRTTSEKIEEYWQKQRGVSKEAGKVVENSIKGIGESQAAGQDFSGGLRTPSGVSQAIDKADLERKRRSLQYLETVAKGGETSTKLGFVSASQIHAGGAYGGGTQEEAITKAMGGEDAGTFAEATAFRGGALHRQIQAEYVKKYPGTKIEQYVEDVENKISGHFDILYEEAGQKILTDIKTIYSTAVFDRLKELSSEIENRKITVQEKLEELKSNKSMSDFDKDIVRRLEDYLSQVNVYLKHVEGATGKILGVSQFNTAERFEIPVGKFDPARFEKDLSVVNKARGGVPTGTVATETAPQASAAEILNRMNPEQQDRYDKLSKSYMEDIRRAQEQGLFNKGEQWFATGGAGGTESKRHILAPGEVPSFKGTLMGAGGAGVGGMPPIPPTGGGGGGDDDDFYKKLKELLDGLNKRIKNVNEIQVEEIVKLVEYYEQAGIAADAARQSGNEDLAGSFDVIRKEIEALMTSKGQALDSAKKIADYYKQLNQSLSASAGAGGPSDFGRLGMPQIERNAPERPEAKHQNLRAMWESSVKYYKLADTTELNKFPGGISDIIKSTAEQGPTPDITKQIREAIAGLPEGQQGGMRRIWMFYKKAVGEYYLKRLDELKQTIEEEGDSSKARQAYAEYEQVVDKYIKNIESTLTKMSDIYTKVGPSGVKGEWVEPDLAKLTGMYEDPKKLADRIKHDYKMKANVQPLMDTMVGDLDATKLDQMATPIDKVREAFRQITAEKADIKPLLADLETFKRLGPEAVQAWDFSKISQDVTELRAGMQAFHRLNLSGYGGLGEGYTEVVRKNVEDTIKLLKQLENSVSSGNLKASEYKLTPVPQFLDTESQRLLHRRNVVQLRETFRTPTEAGGPQPGAAINYKMRIIDPASKQEIENVRVEFNKLGESATTAGVKIGLFSERYENMLTNFQDRRGIGQAFERVIRWGLASNVVYGLTGALNDMIQTISDTELGMAKLRQVMSPLETDFTKLQNSAVQFAKEYGTSVNKVLEGMIVYAQQGINQREVVDRTQTSMMAANVTTLNAADATEALTAAMMNYGKEGETAMRFLDSWTEVEARHAVTSKDLADALRRTGAVAKTVGVTFDQLNGITTAIGETTRFTGAEIGTAERYIFRRLETGKGPAELSKVGIGITSKTGDLRSAFDILGDLAGAWDKLTNSQQLNIAAAIGGLRHFNSLIVLMENWNEALIATQQSMDSKGAAERRNAIVMDTYAKKIEQVKAAVSELQIQFGSAFLPVAKTFLDAVRSIVEAFSNIPPWVKATGAVLGGFFVMLAKGKDILDYFHGMFGGFGSSVKDAISTAVLEWKKGLFEISGFKSPGLNITGLKKVTEVGHVSELDTMMGKLVYKIAPIGRAWNSVLTDVFKGASTVTDKLADMFDYIAGSSFKLKGALSLTGVGSFLGAGLAGFGAVSDVAAYGLDKISQLLGMTAQQTAKWTQENTGLLATFGPLIGSFIILEPLLAKLWNGIKRSAMSSKDYQVSLADTRRQQSDQLSAIRELASGYDILEKRLKNAQRMGDPKVAKKAMDEGTYKSPTREIGNILEATVEYSNKLADSNDKLVLSYDKFGNAALKGADSLKTFIKVAETSKIGEMFSTDLDILKKHLEDLTDVGFGEKLKRELKRFLNEIPGFGPQMAKMIHVSPAKMLEEETGNIDKLLSARARYPMTTAFDKTIKERSESLKKSRDEFQDTYKEFKKILAELPTKGLSSGQIQGALTSPELQEGYKLMAQMEPRLRVTPESNKTERIPGFWSNLIKGATGHDIAARQKVQWQDVMGIEVMKRLNPDQPFDYTKKLTQGLFMQSGVQPRKVGDTVFSGERVFFSDKIAEKYKIAANQGILKITETANGFMERSVEVFDTALNKMRKLPYGAVSKYVENIFPIKAIQEDLSENLEAMKEMVVGAEAGLVGLTGKQFKKDFPLGARFFSQIPTSTLIQSTKGYQPGTGYGEIPFKQDWPKFLEESFIKPMHTYKLMTDQFTENKRSETPLIGAKIEDLEKQADLIRNNQIVVQFMGVFEDLNKILSEGTRTLEHNIMAERTRFELLTNVTGTLAGLPRDLKELDLGRKAIEELTPQQRMALDEQRLPPERRNYLNTSMAIRSNEMRRESAVNEIVDIRKAMLDIGEIINVSRGFGNVLTPEEMEKYTENIAKTGDKAAGMQLTSLNSIDKNTADSSASLNELNATMSDVMGGFKTKSFEAVKEMSPRFIKSEMERVGPKLADAIKEGNIQRAQNLDQYMGRLVQELIMKIGVGPALQQSQNIGGMTKSPVLDFARRALGVTTYKEFGTKLNEVSPGVIEKPLWKELMAAEEKNNATSITSNKTLQQVLMVYSLMNSFEKTAADKNTGLLREQLAKLEDVKNTAKPGTDLTGIDKQITETNEKIANSEQDANARLAKELLGPIALASEELLKQMGLSEGTIRTMGKIVGGAYLGGKLYETMTGVPVGDKLQGLYEKAGKGGSFAKERAAAESAIKKEGSILDPETKKKFDALLKEQDEAAKKGPKSLFEEAKEKYRADREKKAEAPVDKLLNETQDQTTILHGIYENTRTLADKTTDAASAVHGVLQANRPEEKNSRDAIISSVDELRKEYITRNPGSLTGKLLLAATVVGATGYVKEIGAMRNILNTLGGRAANETGIGEKFAKENIPTLEKAISVHLDEILKRAGIPETKRQLISEVADPKKRNELFIAELNRVAGLSKEELDRLTAVVKDERSALSELPTKLATAMEDAIRKGVRDVFPFLTRTNVKALGGPLREAGLGEGAIPEIPGIKSLSELTGLERAVVESRKVGNTSLEKEIYAYKSLSAQRQNFIDKQTVDLIDIGKKDELFNATTDPTEKSLISVEIELLKKSIKDTAKNIDEVTLALDKLAKVPVVNALGTLLQSFEKMKRSFIDTEVLTSFKRLTDASEKTRLGGKHPLSPQYPTFEMLKMGVKGEDLFKYNQFDQQKMALLARGGQINLDEWSQIEFNTKKAVMQHEQQPEEDKLNRQQSAAEQTRQMLLEAQRNINLLPESETKIKGLAEVEELVNYLENQLYNSGFKRTVADEYSGVTREEYLGVSLSGFETRIKNIISKFGPIDAKTLTELEKQTGILTNIEDVLRKAYNIPKEISSPIFPYQSSNMESFKGADYTVNDRDEALRKKISESMPSEARFIGREASARRGGKSLGEEIEQGSQAFVDFGSLIKRKWNELGVYLNAPNADEPPIRVLTFQDELDKAGAAITEFSNIVWEKGGNAIKTVLEYFAQPDLIPPQWRNNYGDDYVAPEGQQTGGQIVGPGGPTDDVIPIMASSGEYVIKAASAKRLGKNALNYINTTGQLPRLAGGGDLDYFYNPENQFDESGYFPKSEQGAAKSQGTSFVDTWSRILGKAGAGVGEFAGNITDYWSGKSPDNFLLPNMSMWTKEEEMDYARQNPNKYALTATAASFMPMAKYAYSPTDVEEFNASSRGSKLLSIMSETPGKIMGGGKAAANLGKLGQGVGKLGQVVGKGAKETYELGQNFGVQSALNVSGKVIKIMDFIGVGDPALLKSKLATRAAESLEDYFYKVVDKVGIKALFDKNMFGYMFFDSKNVSASKKAVKDAIDQIAEFTKYVDPHDINFKKFSVGTSEFLGDYSQKTGTIRLGMQSLLNPLQTVKDYAASTVKKSSPWHPFTPRATDVFKSTMSHELGHGFTKPGPGAHVSGSAEKMVGLGKNTYETTQKYLDTQTTKAVSGTGRFKRLKDVYDFYSQYENEARAIKEVKDSIAELTPKVSSRYGLTNVDEKVATLIEGAMHTPMKYALPDVKQAKKLLGIQYAEGGSVMPSELVAYVNKIMAQKKSGKLMVGNLVAKQDASGKWTFSNANRIDELTRATTEGRRDPWELMSSAAPFGLTGPSDISKLGPANAAEFAQSGRYASVGEGDNKVFAFRDDKGQWVLSNVGDSIHKYGPASYAQGTSYVPNTQLAMLHKGEAVIPAKFNQGGQVGNVIDTADMADIGTQISDAITTALEPIVSRMENININFNIPTSEELPKLEIGNLEDLKNVIGNVGADGAKGKIDTFIDTVKTELKQFDSKIVDGDKRITILESSKLVEESERKSELESKLTDAIAEITQNELAPMKSNISMLQSTLNNAINETDKVYDKVTSLSNRVSLIK